MMKIFLFFVLFFLSNYSFGQTDSTSLQKYSYSVVGFNLPAGGVYGTGFFMKGRNSLYLITAKHVLTGCDGGKIKANTPEKMFVFVPGAKRQIITINTLKTKIENPCRETLHDSDFIAIEIDTQYLRFVNTVNEFIRPIFKNVKQANIFGYPWYSYGNDQYAHFFNPSTKMNLDEKVYGFHRKLDTLTNIIDSTSCGLIVDPFIGDKDSLDGFSGSPFFIQNEKKEWRIIGVFFGSGVMPDGKESINYVPIEFVLNEIKDD